MAQIKMTEEDKKWRARDDARTLVQAFEISQDKARLKRAQTEAREMAIKAQKEAAIMSRVSSSTGSQKKQSIGQFTLTRKGVQDGD